MRSKKLKKHYENIKWCLRTGFESAIGGTMLPMKQANGSCGIGTYLVIL